MYEDMRALTPEEIEEYDKAPNPENRGGIDDAIKGFTFPAKDTELLKLGFTVGLLFGTLIKNQAEMILTGLTRREKEQAEAHMWRAYNAWFGMRAQRRQEQAEAAAQAERLEAAKRAEELSNITAAIGDEGDVVLSPEEHHEDCALLCDTWQEGTDEAKDECAADHYHQCWCDATDNDDRIHYKKCITLCETNYCTYTKEHSCWCDAVDNMTDEQRAYMAAQQVDTDEEMPSVVTLSVVTLEEAGTTDPVPAPLKISTAREVIIHALTAVKNEEEDEVIDLTPLPEGLKENPLS